MKTRYGLEIRAPNGADAPGLAELLRAADVTVSPDALGQRLEVIRQGTETALIASEWGPPSGLILMHWYHSLLAGQPNAQITLLLVGPEQRRRGIGRLLVKAAARSARVAGCGTLEVLAAAGEPTLPLFCLATGFAAAGPVFVRPLRKKA